MINSANKWEEEDLTHTHYTGLSILDVTHTHYTGLSILDVTHTHYTGLSILDVTHTLYWSVYTGCDTRTILVCLYWM